MNIGLYSVTYRGIWYRGDALDLPAFLRVAHAQGWEGVELDTERPHAAPMDLNAEERKRLRGLAEDLALSISAVSPRRRIESRSPAICGWAVAYRCLGSSQSR